MSEPNAILCAKNSVTSSAFSNVKIGEIQCRRKKHRDDIVEDKKKNHRNDIGKHNSGDIILYIMLTFETSTWV